jgi:hypothetical protein
VDCSFKSFNSWLNHCTTFGGGLRETFLDPRAE